MPGIRRNFEQGESKRQPTQTRLEDCRGHAERPAREGGSLPRVDSGRHERMVKREVCRAGRVLTVVDGMESAELKEMVKSVRKGCVETLAYTRFPRGC